MSDASKGSPGAGPLVAGLRRWLRRIVPAALGLVALLYLASGLCTVRPGEVGLVRQFGRLIGERLPPGLHYHLPWPFQRVERVAVFRSLVLEAGFWPDKPALYTHDGPAPAGERVRPGQFCLTGDKNVIHSRLVVHYTIGDPAGYLDTMREPERVLAAVVDATLLKVIGRMGVDAILTQAKRTVADAVLAEAQGRLRRVGSPLEIASVELTQAEPPEAVRPAFREVINAQNEMTTAIHQAEGQREQILAQAAGEAAQKLAEAEAYAQRRRFEAQGQAQRFLELAAAYRGAEEVTRRRLWLDMIQTVLPAMKKVVAPASQADRLKLFVGPSEAPPKEKTP